MLSQEGAADMANTPQLMVRAEPELVADAHERSGLPPHAGVSEVVRYALAVMAGRPDPERVAAPRRGGPKLAAASAADAPPLAGKVRSAMDLMKWCGRCLVNMDSRIVLRARGKDGTVSSCNVSHPQGIIEWAEAAVSSGDSAWFEYGPWSNVL